MINCLIIDDEAIARQGLEKYLAQTHFLNLIGSCKSPESAFDIITSHQVDLLLLDIQMPFINGIDFLKTLQSPPMTIFITAFSQFALDSYELDVIDYLVKPVSLDRFQKACQKAHDFKDYKLFKANQESIFIKSKGRIEKINLQEILFLKAEENYTSIVTMNQKFLTLINLKHMEEQLSAKGFLRVHKSYLVPIKKIRTIDHNTILIDGYSIPYSKTIKSELLNMI